MTGKRLLARVGWAAALGMVIFLVLSSAESHATPIRPDLQKMLKQSEQAQQPFIPARAGWTESSTVTVPRNPVLDSVFGDRMRQELRQELAMIATPDPFLVLALATLILLMRKLRSIEAKRHRLLAEAGIAPVPAELRPAA